MFDKKTWYERNKRVLSVKGKLYREKNKKKLAEYYRLWREKTGVN